MPELFLVICLLAIVVFFFSPYDLTIDEEED